jgi:hypothetical protein
VTLGGAEVYVELLALLVALVPLGLLLLRLVERFRGRTLRLTAQERLVLAPYLSGALLFVLASGGVPVFGAPLLVGAIVVGAAALLALWVRERGGSLRPALVAAESFPAWIVAGAMLAVLALEVVANGARPYPNAYDGSFQSLYLQLLLTHHSVAWTLLPYANAGVIYPQSATVWLSFPVLLWNWPIPTAPVALPLLFMALAVPAAYCWGERLGGVGVRRGRDWGLLFAAAFAAFLSMPRFFIGGSYDFVFGLPLFFLALGWLRPFVRTAARSWRDVVLFGGLLGVLTCLSLALGEALVLLLVAYGLVDRARSGLTWPGVVARLGAILAIAALFVARSIAGVIVWYSYPAHVLSATGSPPYVPISGLPAPTTATFNGDLNPFVPFKPKLSPLPILSLEIAFLLAIGLAIALAGVLLSRTRHPAWFPLDAIVPLGVGAVVLFLWTAWLVAASGPASFASVFDSLASVYESSYLLFLFYQALALIPLLALIEKWRTDRPDAVPFHDRPKRYEPHVAPVSARNRRSGQGAVVVLAVLLAIPLASGVVVSAVQAPGYLSTHLDELSNVTAGDVAALTWAGSALPSCSTVLVAPGSAAEFLPVFARVHVDFPMMPLSVNLSYNVSVGDLIRGVYDAATRAALLSLGVTEVFVTGRTSVSYLPLDPAPMENSSDFTPLFHAGDAVVFGFGPGIAATGCPLVESLPPVAPNSIVAAGRSES